MKEVTILSLLNDLDLIRIKLLYLSENSEIVGNKKCMYNFPFSFDIETTSFYDQEGEKAACMYIWMFALPDETVIIGRTWGEFQTLNNLLEECLGLNQNLSIYVSVCNLAYEFQFMRKWFDWEKVFSIGSRAVAYCINSNWVTYKCAYIQSGCSLAKIANDLKSVKIEKGKELDYHMIRHSGSPLSDEELSYCIKDVLILIYYIKEQIEKDGNILKIKLTKTSYVRSYMIDSCLFDLETDHNTKKALTQFSDYKRIMGGLICHDKEELFAWEQAFGGGYVHSSPLHSRQTIGSRKHPADSIDFTSSYPFCIVAFPEFPIGEGELIEVKKKSEFYKIIQRCACIFEIEFIDLVAKFDYDYYISKSKCWESDGLIDVNGRVQSAKSVKMTITNIDFEIISNCYEFKKIRIGRFWKYKKGYLPTKLIECILKLYADKTELKDVEGREDDYMLAKAMLNSVYGCMVTKIIQPNEEYIDDHWATADEVEPMDIDEEIDKYNRKFNRVLFFPWGVFCTALARRNLWLGIGSYGNNEGGIISFGNDYLYSDTDSIKCINFENHKKDFDLYNKWCEFMIKKAMKHHNLPIELAIPKTIKGVEKPLGVWEWETEYARYIGFKSLRAKAYLVNQEGKGLKLTVAGLNKKIAIPYIMNRYKDKVFESFDDDLDIPAEASGKLTHTYIDGGCSGKLIDMYGNVGDYWERSYIHLEGAEFHLSLMGEYLKYLMEVQSE